MKNEFDEMMKTSYCYDATAYRESSQQWAILRNLYDHNFVNAASKDFTRMPKRIHQIWIGSAIPSKYLTWGDTWRKHNPGWEYRLWTDKDVDEIEMKNPKLLGMLSNYGAKSDFMRYHIINQYGGIYIDTDFECVKSFDDLTYLDFLIGVGYDSIPQLYVGLIGSVPHHPIMERIVEQVNLIDKDIRIPDVLNNISANFFTRNFFHIVRGSMPGVLALPPDYLYPFPNDKGHSYRDGLRFVKPCSYAVHHWEVSWTARTGRTDWIQGDRFKEIADFVYAPRERHGDDYDGLVNTFAPSELYEDRINVIYTHTMYVRQLLDIIRYLRYKFVVITHNSDMCIDDTYDVPDNVVHWFAQNVNVRHPRIESLPIGLANDRWDVKQNRKVALAECSKRKKSDTKLVYMNHLDKTNPAERAPLTKLFARKPWVTIENKVQLRQYINQIYDHKFVLCPVGNGIDTHRLWETLYLRTIPIVKRDINSAFYEDLPICFVNDWSEVNPTFLQAEYDRITNKAWNYEKLNFTYWRRKIEHGAK